jgi:hypothetical protein
MQNLMKRETQTGNSLVRYPTAEGELGQGIKRPTQKVVFGATCTWLQCQYRDISVVALIFIEGGCLGVESLHIHTVLYSAQ